MPEKQIESQIMTFLQSPRGRPLRPRKLARELGATAEDEYHAFRNALRQLMREGGDYQRESLMRSLMV